MSEDGARLEQLATELYGEPPGGFVAARTALVKQARAEGDKPLADQVGRLRKPSVAAWLVNQLVRRHGELVDQVLDLGEQLREAQQNLDGDQLRALDRQRRQVVTGVTRQARALGEELGQRVSDQVVTAVENTLRAGMADEAAAAAVRSGLLTEALSAAGFGPLDLAVLVAVPTALETPASRPQRDASQDQARRVRAAEAALRAARSATEKARAGSVRADTRRVELTGRAEALREQLAALEEELNAATAAATEASGALARAVAAQEEAEAALGEVGGPT